MISFKTFLTEVLILRKKNVKIMKLSAAKNNREVIGMGLNRTQREVQMAALRQDKVVATKSGNVEGITDHRLPGTRIR